MSRESDTTEQLTLSLTRLRIPKSLGIFMVLGVSFALIRQL